MCAKHSTSGQLSVVSMLYEDDQQQRTTQLFKNWEVQGMFPPKASGGESQPVPAFGSSPVSPFRLLISHSELYRADFNPDSIIRSPQPFGKLFFSRKERWQPTRRSGTSGRGSLTIQLFFSVLLYSYALSDTRYSLLHDFLRVSRTMLASDHVRSTR